MSLGDSAYAIYHTLAISLPTVIEAAVGRVTTEKCDARLDGWAKKLIRRAEIDLHVHGAERVPWDRPYVIMSNHQSLYDIPVLYAVVRGTMRMVTKKELFKVPIWGRAMRAAGMICVDRSDRNQAVASLRSAAEQTKLGVHVWIAPEGTRSRTGQLGKLKRGGFHLARDTQTPILPVALTGTRDVLSAKAAVVQTGKRVDVTFGEPIPVAGKDLAELQRTVMDFFERHVNGEGARRVA